MKTSKIHTKRVFVSILSFVLLALFNSIIIKANAGQLPFSMFGKSVHHALIKTTSKSITIGQAMIIGHLFLTILGYLIFKNKRNILNPIFSTILFGFMIDFWMWIIPLPYDLTNVLPYWARVLMLVVFTFLVMGSVSLVIESNIFLTSLDYFIFAIKNRMDSTFPKAIRVGQYGLLTGSFLLMSYAKNFSPISIPSLVLIPFLPKMLKFWVPLTKPLYDKFIHSRNKTIN